jgi:hypothetical protein
MTKTKRGKTRNCDCPVSRIQCFECGSRLRCCKIKNQNTDHQLSLRRCCCLFSICKHQPHYGIVMGKQNGGGGSSSQKKQQKKKKKTASNHNPDRAVQEKYLRDLYGHFRSVYGIDRWDESLALALARPTCHVALVNPRTSHAQVELLFGNRSGGDKIGENQGDRWRRLIPHSNLI